ncbi:MAG: hypothetical protein UU08_C0001G0022 [Candidatus Uhrbacteria bacterium GW2011_GWE2_40_58]|nr:MAG: hypothetical protein UT94_C0001G0022 [Candidatus Uhrbacteria bacterium GW2011_GWF2_40_263]KKR68248.1 MAG: hypothetical protein UU08_C0001G0022 [Candidatus Uhrbacteria bacterium GW2011_GWE2_40_58]OGL92051.1 MAG: hypothetical protein A2239_03495 [Candidatus Uhrbacteria bacterium RIFOXYA2_FULL_40_9]OGL97509.1 MAG: hypothetical protein A2332_00200 [Candidatus Uhrbacteria bacterium RIFOXYB2_FULL_41_18]HBK35104.1 hypothetical protein [Candidatus Uhrbacteria bacterium]
MPQPPALSPLSAPSISSPRQIIFSGIKEACDPFMVRLQSRFDHFLTVQNLPDPLQRLILPLIHALRTQQCEEEMIDHFEYSTEEGIRARVNSKPLQESLASFFHWQEDDLLGRLDLLVWFMSYHRARRDRATMRFSYELRCNGRFDVFGEKILRSWNCPDCGHTIPGTDDWCRNPHCVSRHLFACCTGQTPILIVIEGQGKGRKQKKPLEGLKALHGLRITAS